MLSVPSTSTSHPNFASIFNAALESYRRTTKKDLASHPLLPSLQHCDSPEAILSVLQEIFPTLNQSRNSDNEITNWLIPTVNVLSAFSNTLGQVVGLAFPPANIIFAGIGALLSAARDTSTKQDKVIDLLNRIGYFFQRLVRYTEIKPTTAMMDLMVAIMVEVLTTLAITAKEMKYGRLKRCLKMLMGNSDFKDSLEKLDKLTQEEARMASAELLKVTHVIDEKVTGVEEKVKGVNETVKGIEGEVQNVLNDVQDISNAVEGAKGNIRDIHSDVQDVSNEVSNIGGDVKDISGGIQNIVDKVDQVYQKQARDGSFKWLSAPDLSINQYNARKSHHGGTAQWFLQGKTFNQWKSSGSLLWIHGKPGSGKTVLCSSIIEDIKALRDAEKALMANFYFDFNDADKQYLRNLLPSLLIQLSAQSNRCRLILSHLYSKHDRGVRKPSDRDLVDCLKEMLSLEAQGPTYIIMDALDECPVASPRDEVLELVEELVGLHLPNLHICVTSRPEHDIQSVLKPLTECSVSLHDESGQQEDIANYIASSVRSDKRMLRWRDEEKNLVIKTLSEKANGMFKWVSCQLELLRDCFPSSIRRILEELPENLDETYERILKKIRKHKQGHAHRMLQCLVAAARPLRVEELAELLAFDFDGEGIPELNLYWRWEDQEEAVKSTCSSLVTVVEVGDTWIVQFSHLSVKEFLMGDRLRLAGPDLDVSRYYIGLDAAHTVLVRACLGVLLRLNDDVDQDNIKHFPLAHYSAQYWTTHAQFPDVLPHIENGMECLFDTDKPHFATWLWIYNDDQDGRSMSTMRPEKPEASPLYYAASFGFRNLAERLIAKHPEHVIAKGGKAVTVMHVAAREGYADILSLLLEHGADVDVQGSSGQTPLHRAAWSGKVDAGKRLLDRGADIDARGDGGWTPLFFAAIQGHVEFARMLLERGAAINVRTDKTNESPLHWAAQGGEIQCVQLLLEHGADVNALNKFDDIPSQVALGPKRQEIVKLLSMVQSMPV